MESKQARPDPRSASDPPTAYYPRRILAAAAVVACVGIGALLAGRFPQIDGHYGIWSLAPPAVAIVLAFATRNVIVALFAGIFVGGVVSGQFNIVQDYLIPSIGSQDYALILLVYLWALGGLIGLWARTGGAAHFAQWASRKVVRGPRSAKLFAWLMGLVFHQGGTISTVLTGATVRPVADQHRVSHEELSYVVDSTASPAATLIPFNIWPIYVGGLVAGTIPIIPTAQDGIELFFKAIPYNFYALIAIALTLLLAWEKLPLIPSRKMQAAMKRARDTGKLDRDGAVPLTSGELTELRVDDKYRPGLIDFFGPISLLLGIAILPYLITYFVLGWRDDPRPLLLIAEAFVISVLVAILIAVSKGMPLLSAMKGFIEGCKGVTIGAIILGLAITLKGVAESVGTADYVVGFAGGLPAVALPALFLAMCMIIAFSTGTSFGTFAVFFPVAMPLAWAVQPDPGFITIAFAAGVGGSLFGDQCSPISDTTILSSLGTGADLMDHVYTQIPLALTAAAIAGVIYTVLVAFL